MTGPRQTYNFLFLARMAALAGTLFICSPGAVSCPKTKPSIKMEHLFVEKDNNRTVDIRLNETVRITLPENATTGYRWAIESYDKEFLNELGTEPQYAKGPVGSGGEIVFNFKGKKIGTGDIMLKQLRSWEGDSSVIARFHIRIHVQP
jgi:inhibitor of cysteine peptidase